MKIEQLQEQDQPAVEHFLSQVPLDVPGENFSQFWVPRKSRGGYEIGLLGLKDGGRLVGTLGYIEVPLRIDGSQQKGRWPINFFLLKNYRRRGFGRELLNTMRDSNQWCLVTGGTEDSTTVFEKTGWQLVGKFSSRRWFAPCLNPPGLSDRLCRTRRKKPPETITQATPEGTVLSRRTETIAGDFAWVPDASSHENGIPRDVDFLAFAFGHALKKYYIVYVVYLKERPVGYFVLSASADRFPLLAAQIVDCEARSGREAMVLRAASRTGLLCADLVRLRMLSPRFIKASSGLGGSRQGPPGVPFRVLPPHNYHGNAHRSDSWHITCADHDEYRCFPDSQIWKME